MCSSWQDGRVTFKAKNKIIPGQTVEFVRPGVQPYVITVPDDIWDDEGNKVEAANHPTHVFSLPCEEPMAAATPMRAPKLALKSQSDSLERRSAQRRSSNKQRR